MQSPKEPLVKDVMRKRVSVIESNRTAKEAAEKMKKRKVRELIVVSGRDVVGILVDRDLTTKIIAEGRNPEEIKIKEIMSKNLITATENESLEDVALRMVKNNVSRIPVVRGEQLVGLLTYRDILKAWPGYLELLKEEIHLSEEESNNPGETLEGICDSCGNYSEELRMQGNLLLCPDCSEE